MDKSRYIIDSRFKEIEPFPDKVWLSSPTMHGEELKWVEEAYESNRRLEKT